MITIYAGISAKKVSGVLGAIFKDEMRPGSAGIEDVLRLPTYCTRVSSGPLGKPHRAYCLIGIEHADGGIACVRR